tara:strand:+ start:1302 stop:1703 length:402 start_codon:yes stop_codon:yes gene_type:complete
MIRRIDISNYLYVLMMIFMFICGTAIGQTFATNDTFDNNIAKDITVVEFWAGWNSANEFKELIKLKDCNIYRVDIMNCMDIQTEYNVSAIPTIIIFDNGIEKERFLPNIMFQLEVDKKVIQNSVDTITLNKFQ